jgi:NTE family protein
MIASSITEPAALVLSGGGARGAYQVGVLKALSEKMPGPLPFGVVTGVSVGAINAAVIAERADDFPAGAAKLEALWRGLRCSSVYDTRTSKILARLGGFLTSFARPAPRALLDASPLAELLAREIDFGRLAAMVGQGHLQALAVTASSYSDGHSVTFYQGSRELRRWSRSRRRGEHQMIGVDHVLASAALPAVFESRRIGNTWYGDGALRQVAPLSPAIHLGSQRLFLIAARDGVPDAPDTAPGEAPYPPLGLLAGQLLDIVFNDHLDADLERLDRINQTLERMSEERRGEVPLVPIATHLVRPSEDIRLLAGAHWAEAPDGVRLLLRLLGASEGDGTLPSYLVFEPGYVGALIDLGYADARAEMDRLLAFIRNEPSPVS